jgi:hypothetical protein
VADRAEIVSAFDEVKTQNVHSRGYEECHLLGNKLPVAFTLVSFSAFFDPEHADNIVTRLVTVDGVLD